jgi:hypothetical protein
MRERQKRTYVYGNIVDVPGWGRGIIENIKTYNEDKLYTVRKSPNIVPREFRWYEMLPVKVDDLPSVGDHVAISGEWVGEKFEPIIGVVEIIHKNTGWRYSVRELDGRIGSYSWSLVKKPAPVKEPAPSEEEESVIASEEIDEVMESLLDAEIAKIEKRLSILHLLKERRKEKK